MPVKSLVKPSEYHDSVSLMAVAQELAHLPGVIDAAVVMATEANKGILRQAGLLTPEADAASPNDLVIAVNAETGLLEHAIAEADKLLRRKSAASETIEFRPKTVRSAIKANPAANLAVVSVAGRYAADEAWEALHKGLHVLLFSDNVSLQDEIALKKYAIDHGLLLMGPGAGTAIINGVALGFADALPKGPVGIVSAAGTGLQEVSTLLARHAVGITQGIGTGGRDVKDEVGGMMMLAGLRALQADPDTQVILLISKPPGKDVARNTLEQAAMSGKPTVVCFLGARDISAVHKPAGVWIVPTLQEAALQAARLGGAQLPEIAEILSEEEQWLAERAAMLRKQLQPGQRYLRGLFSGGTLCYEAQVIWREALSEPVFSNAPLDKENQLPDSTRSQGHTAVDLGEEEFTVGRPHPMIDNSLRIRRLLQEAGDPEVAVILLDVVLGFGAHPDPAAELAPAVLNARNLATQSGRGLIVVASVTGTEEDPQRLSRQVQTLEQAGVVVCPSNATASRLVTRIVSSHE